MLDPRAFFINNKTGRVVATTFIEFLSGNSTTPSICFTDSPDSGLQCDNSGAVNYIKNGTNLGEIGTPTTLPLFTSTDPGLVSGSGGGTANFLRADGTWALPPSASGGITDGDKGDITVSNSGFTWTIDTGVVSTSKLGGDVTTAGKALLDDSDAAAQRITLGLGGSATLNVGTTTGTVAAGDDGRFTTDLTYTAGTRVLASSTGADATLPLFTSTDAGLTPSSGGGTTNFLRADGTWAAPVSGGTPGGSDTQVQFNDGGSTFGGDTGLTFDKTTNTLTVGVDNADPGTAIVKGDINLDDGGTYATTLQLITPTANRTISFPDATGTVALVGGSNGQLVYNNAGAYAGASNTSVGASGDITLSLNGAADTPPLKLTGTWFTGGTSTTTKPQFLIEPSGTTSTTWSTSGTGLGVNAPSGFSGNLLDLQVNGTSRLRATSAGGIDCAYNGNAFLRVDAEDYQHFNAAAKRDMLLGGNAQGLAMPSHWSVSWGTTVTTPLTKDLTLSRDAAGILAQRNGTNAQTFRLYGTYTDGSNYERAYLRWASNVLEIGTEGAGTGSEKPVRITAATLKLPNLPTYADNTAATSGGLVAGDVYKTATGELRITV